MQFMLIPRLLWPLLIYDVSNSMVEATEKKIRTAIRKWLGVPPCLSDVALYCKKAKIIFPFMSVTEEYKAGKARLAMMLRESVDVIVRKTLLNLTTERKWKARKAVDSTQEALKLKEVMGHTQINRLGFDKSNVQLRSKASLTECREMVVLEICKTEDGKRIQKAVQQSQQRRWKAGEWAMQRSQNW